MIREHIRLALTTIRHAKLRSALTMLGIIIGVSSVTTVLSIGQGVRNQVADEVAQFGSNLIQVTPGKGFVKNDEGEVESFNFTAAFGTSTLSENDLKTIQASEGVDAAAPFMIISGNVTSDDKTISNALIVATNSDLPEALNLEVGDGSFFNTQQTGNVVVIGSDIAEQVFGARRAIGGVIDIRGERFAVIGVMAKRTSNLSFGGPDLNDAVYIPLEAGKRFNQGVVQIQEIDIKGSDGTNLDDTVRLLEEALQTNHGGADDFSVVKQSELVKVADTILGLITSFVAAIAAISLAVGGIGIMNIMLVSVTERTREIGLRKAVGATNRQILLQFLIEAVVLSLVGGLLGLVFAFLIVTLIAAFSDISGAFSPGTLVLAVGVSVAVGVIFGIAPAAKAARKHPIDALRYE